MTSFARQHEYRIGRALLVATLLVVLGSWFFPLGWLRFFGREWNPGTTTALPPGRPWVRLIPTESLPGQPVPELVRIRTVPVKISPVPDLSPEPSRREWSFDPTTPWRPLAGELSPLAPAAGDSVLLHAEFLHSLRLGNMAAILAMLDTTQTGRAREQLAETDDWIHRYLAPVWESQGRAARIADIYWRAVGEVEAEGSQ